MLIQNSYLKRLHIKIKYVPGSNPNCLELVINEFEKIKYGWHEAL